MVLVLRIAAWIILAWFGSLALIALLTISDPAARDRAMLENVVVGVVLWVIVWFIGNVLQKSRLP